MSLSLNPDGRLEGIPFDARLAVSFWIDETWQPAETTLDGWTLTAQTDIGEARIELTAQEGALAYALSLSADRPTRVGLWLEVPEARDPYHILPGVLFGDNSLHRTTGMVLPHLTHAPRRTPNLHPHWEFRADRCSHPVSMVAFAGGVVGLSVAPYCDDARGLVRTPPDSELLAEEPFARNGVFAHLPDSRRFCACGVTLGYRNTPLTMRCKGNYVEPTAHLLTAGSTAGRLFCWPAEDRRAVHKLIRSLYADLRETPASELTAAEGARRIRRALVTVGWDAQAGNCTDMRNDPQTGEFKAFRVNDEIAWTGGTQTALPLLVGGHRDGDDESVEKACVILDRIAAPESINPDSGWLWDVCGDANGRTVDGWWIGAGRTHYAYTNGEAACYLLSAYRYAHEQMNLDRPAWRDTALTVVDKALSVQDADGRFGYAYSPETGEVVDSVGFAGCWFAGAAVQAGILTGEGRYFDAARRALEGYYPDVQNLDCYGTPMDTFKAVDEEGILSFIRAARLMHEATGEQAFLEMLADGAEYEFLWRFAFRSRPQAPPLKGTTWNSCGGSLTSVSNPHIHPMGICVSGDLAYLAEATGDDYFAQRLEDGLLWGLNCVQMYPEPMGYGSEGVLTERFCPSDGLLTERYADGSVSSVWFTFHTWGAACVLEGLLDAGERLG